MKKIKASDAGILLSGIMYLLCLTGAMFSETPEQQVLFGMFSLFPAIPLTYLLIKAKP
jgi:hypothetical protein